MSAIAAESGAAIDTAWQRGHVAARIFTLVVWPIRLRRRSDPRIPHILNETQKAQTDGTLQRVPVVHVECPNQIDLVALLLLKAIPDSSGPATNPAGIALLTAESLRAVQRRFLQATGVTQSAARQIERARYAALLLMRGDSIADVTHEAGYFDQPHLTRSMKRLIGQTPAKLRRNSFELSYLYKTQPFDTP